MTLAKATTPLAAAAMHTTTRGYTPVFTAIAACCAAAAGRYRRQRPTDHRAIVVSD